MDPKRLTWSAKFANRKRGCVRVGTCENSHMNCNHTIKPHQVRTQCTLTGLVSLGNAHACTPCTAEYLLRSQRSQAGTACRRCCPFAALRSREDNPRRQLAESVIGNAQVRIESAQTALSSCSNCRAGSCCRESDRGCLNSHAGSESVARVWLPAKNVGAQGAQTDLPD